MRLKNLFYKTHRTIAHLTEKPIIPNTTLEQLHFTIVITAYNNKAYVFENLKSVLQQQYDNFNIFYIDDCSTDGSSVSVQTFIEQYDVKNQITFVANNERRGKLANLYTAIHQCVDTTIIIELDGDDYLAHNQVLATFNTIYQITKALFVHANYQNNPQQLAQALKLDHFAQQTPWIVKKLRLYRKFPWIYSGLRSYYAWLFKQIKKEDLLCNNEFFLLLHDNAMVYPMLEMAGDKIGYAAQPLLIRNIDSPINDFKKENNGLRTMAKQQLMHAPRYKTIAHEKKLTVVIPSYNNAQWYKKNLDSVFSQNYHNYSVIYIDDYSSDGTTELVANYIKERQQEHRARLICNKQRQGATANRYLGSCMADDNAIVLVLDGDDWLAHNNVFQKINDAYADGRTWLTYGQFRRYPSGIKGQCIKLAQDTDFRMMDKWYTSHLRTYYAWLFKKIKQTDLMHQDAFIDVAGDVAEMLPMLEMARGHIQFIPDILYIYNQATPFNDVKLKYEAQTTMTIYLQRQQPYKQLDFGE